ncbi:MAG: response regulator [Myxococcota bacterium]
MASEAREVVLLADDEPILVRLISRVLAAAGFAVRPAETAEQVCAAFEEGEHIDAAILDLTLARSLGLDALERIVARPGGPALLLVSGADPEPALAQLLARVGGRFLAKPFEPAQLVGSLHDLLASGSR